MAEAGKWQYSQRYRALPNLANEFRIQSDDINVPSPANSDSSFIGAISRSSNRMDGKYSAALVRDQFEVASIKRARMAASVCAVTSRCTPSAHVHLEIESTTVRLRKSCHRLQFGARTTPQYSSGGPVRKGRRQQCASFLHRHRLP